jgi:microcystin-dependent protein
MSEPFLAEIRMVGFNFAPRGWAFCDGQILPINQNQSLYSLLGTTYGGDGRTSFALPDLRGRVPVHVGSSNGHSIRQGEKGGEETHTLSAAEMPRHAHLQGSGDRATEGDPTDRVLASRPRRGLRIYAGPGASFGGGAGSTGGNQAHTNMQPYLAVNFCIALQGLFPSRN